MRLPWTAPLSRAPSHASRAAARSEHPLGVPGARAGQRCVAGLLGAKQLCMLPGHPSLHSPVLSGVPPGMECKSQPLSLFSSCRAPGDEEAQAENLITANGKATRPVCSAAASAWHQPAAELAARYGGLPLAGCCKPLCSSLCSHGSAESRELNTSHAVSPRAAMDQPRPAWVAAPGLSQPQ